METSATEYAHTLSSAPTIEDFLAFVTSYESNPLLPCGKTAAAGYGVGGWSAVSFSPTDIALLRDMVLTMGSDYTVADLFSLLSTECGVGPFDLPSIVGYLSREVALGLVPFLVGVHGFFDERTVQTVFSVQMALLNKNISPTVDILGPFAAFVGSDAGDVDFLDSVEHSAGMLSEYFDRCGALEPAVCAMAVLEAAGHESWHSVVRYTACEQQALCWLSNMPVSSLLELQSVLSIAPVVASEPHGSALYALLATTLQDSAWDVKNPYHRELFLAVCKTPTLVVNADIWGDDWANDADAFPLADGEALAFANAAALCDRERDVLRTLLPTWVGPLSGLCSLVGSIADHP